MARLSGRTVRTAMLMTALASFTAVLLVQWNREATAAPPTTVDGFEPFAHWPKDQKPEVVLVLSGQTFGYLSPCGCSRPQRGGLERRANFMDGLRAKGWPVVGLDLGDVSPPKKVPEQDRLKYKAQMESLRSMGYAAVGLGEYDFNLDLFELLASFTLQNQANPRPVILAANLAGNGNGTKIDREKFFAAGKGQRPMVEDVEVISKDPNGAACLPFSVTGVIGKSVYEKIAKVDPNFTFNDNGDVLKACLAKAQAHELKPAINVLLYAGSLEEAKKVAEAFPQYQLIVCQCEETEPPQFPTQVNNGKTFIAQVGHKGQNVVAVGVFKTSEGFELKYQLVPLGEQFITEKSKEADHPVLKILESYTEEVKNRNLLAKYTEKRPPHPAMVNNPNANLTYVGVDKCKTCHPNEAKIWGESKHSHAYEALEKLAVNPRNRQFDGDCVDCHTIGFRYQGGFTDEKATPHLKHNGCENCHGPGSGHAANPNDKTLLKALMSWKDQPTDKMPAKATLEANAKVAPGMPMAVPLTPAEQKVFNTVGTMCMKCHDGENDPKFDLNLYFPKVWHSGFKAKAGAGLPGNAK